MGLPLSLQQYFMLPWWGDFYTQGWWCLFHLSWLHSIVHQKYSNNNSVHAHTGIQYTKKYERNKKYGFVVYTMLLFINVYKEPHHAERLSCTFQTCSEICVCSKVLWKRFSWLDLIAMTYLNALSYEGFQPGKNHYMTLWLKGTEWRVVL